MEPLINGNSQPLHSETRPDMQKLLDEPTADSDSELLQDEEEDHSMVGGSMAEDVRGHIETPTQFADSVHYCIHGSAENARDWFALRHVLKHEYPKILGIAGLEKFLGAVVSLLMWIAISFAVQVVVPDTLLKPSDGELLMFVVMILFGLYVYSLLWTMALISSEYTSHLPQVRHAVYVLTEYHCCGTADGADPDSKGREIRRPGSFAREIGATPTTPLYSSPAMRKAWL